MKAKEMQIMKWLKYVLGTMLGGVLLYLIVGECFLPGDNFSDNDKCTLFEAQWERILPDGTREKVEVPGECNAQRRELVCIETTLPEYQADTWFCVRSSQQDMWVYIGGELRKEYSTAKQRLYGKNSASVYVFFRVHKEDAGKKLTIETISDSGYSGVLNEVYTGEKDSIWNYFLGQYALIAIVSVIMFILSIITVIYSTLLRYVSKMNMEISYLGWGLLLASLWLFANSRIRQYLLPNISVADSVGFLTVMLLPYPFLVYINQIQKRRYQKLYMGVAVCTIINFLVSVTLQVLNILDFLDTMMVSHTIIVVLVVICAITIFKDFRIGKLKEYIEVAIGFLGLMVATGWEVYLAYQPTSSYSGVALCIGLVFLLFTAGWKTGLDMLAVEKEKQMAIVAGESKARFLANMSHEIRTPINTVIGMNEMILRENQDEGIHEYAQNIQNASRMLLGLINDILDFSKIEAGKMDIIENHYYVSKMLTDVIQGVRFKAESKGLQLILQIDEVLPTVLNGDEIRIRQILNNLLSNAVKYTTQGSITFAVKRGKIKDDFALQVSVTDTGMGIQEQDMKQLFDSFQRLEQKRNQNIEGSGLGLNITKQLAELMGGSITVQSEYGKGSCFTVVIPQQIVDGTIIGSLQDAYKRDTKEKEAVKETLYAPTAQILVVDDTKMNLSVVKALLKRTGVQLDFATGGQICLEMCRKKEYDLILMDHMMPEPDGIETLHLLCNDEKSLNRDTKVVVLTANAIAGVEEQYLAEGFVGYLSKPLVAEDLEEMLLKQLPADKIQTESKSMEDEIMDELLQIDKELGMSYCAGDEELYNEVLQEYYEQGQEYITQLSETYAQKDWAGYRIIAHAIKGTSLTIGAEQFSMKAKELEFAAAEEKEEFLSVECDKFLENYKALLEKVKLQ